MNTSQSPPQPTNLMTLLLVGLPLVIDNGLWPSSFTLAGNTTLAVVECDYVHPPPPDKDPSSLAPKLPAHTPH
jgi:hypothetical protein